MVEHVRYEADLPELRDPLLIAAFGSAWGTSAVQALHYLAERWETTLLAEVDPEPFYDFSTLRPLVRIEDGERTITWPENRFVLARPEGAERDVVFLIGVEPHLRWGEFAEAIAGAMERLGVHESVILGAYRAATPHSRPLSARLFTSDEELAARFGLPADEWTYEGPAGITTVLGVTCEQRGWPPASLLVSAPFYVAVEPHPHATRALVNTLAAMLGVEVDVAPLDEQIEELDAEAERAKDRSEEFAQFISNLEEQYDRAEAAQERDAPPAATPELVEDVEAFLRHQRSGDTGPFSTGTSSSGSS